MSNITHLRDQGNLLDCTGCQNPQVLVLVNRNLHNLTREEIVYA
jgi:hypothetical protein